MSMKNFYNLNFVIYFLFVCIQSNAVFSSLPETNDIFLLAAKVIICFAVDFFSMYLGWIFSCNTIYVILCGWKIMIVHICPILGYNHWILAYYMETVNHFTAKMRNGDFSLVLFHHFFFILISTLGFVSVNILVL